MIPNATLRLVSSSPIAESAEFGISVNDTAHIMGILRDTLYSDKILAVLREYSSNAWDAHQEAGKPLLPIKVTLPTSMEPTLSIRDYGLGLSPDGVFKIYTQYGASTKRNTDSAVGMMGIGSKSGFAYSDSFTVTSFHGGWKRTYVAVLDPSEKGVINLLHSEPSEETGIEISMAVRSEDIRSFESKAKSLYKYFIPRPGINTEIPLLPEAQATLKNGVIYEKDGSYYSTSWVAVMGCVSYRIDFDHIRGSDATSEGGVAEFIGNIAGAVYFDIGDVQVSASREELKYSAETKLALVRKLNALVEEYVKQALDVIMNGALTPWERRVKAQVLGRLKLPVPPQSKDLIVPNVVLEEIPKSFIIAHHRTTVTSIAVNESTRFILLDDARAYAGFEGLSYKDYVIRAVDKNGHFRTAHVKWADIEADVGTMCHAEGIEGIPILKLSSFPWKTPSRGAGGRTINPKHRLSMFTYNSAGGYSKPWSDCWNAVTHVPDASDVFVVIEGFQTPTFDMGRFHREDVALAQHLGGTVPPIYGYKHTEKKPVIAAECLGTPYEEWRKTFALGLVTQKVKDQFELWRWGQVAANLPAYGRYRGFSNELHADLVKDLGADHLITLLVKNNVDGAAYFKKHAGLVDVFPFLLNRAPGLMLPDSIAHGALARINKKYPLFTTREHSVAEVWGPHSEHWLQYVKLVDKY